MSELVSVIIPTYNREKYISSTLYTILLQTYSTWECIIVDDNSTDNTLKIVKAYCKLDNRFKLYKRPTNLVKGANTCRNYGFSKAKGRYINWFDSDDLMTPSFIETKLNTFNINPNIEIVFSKTVKFNTDGYLSFEKRTKMSSNLLEDYILRKVSWYLPDGMFKKSFLDNKKLFLENLKVGQDRNFYTRILLDNPNVKIINRYSTLYRLHNNTITNKLNNNLDINNYHNYNISHYGGLKQEINLLNKKRRITPIIRKHYFLEISKKLPSIIYNKLSVLKYYFLLIKLSSFNYFYIKHWFKIIVATTSLFIFGKGEKFLK